MEVEHWADFSVATAGAGAALAGLLFVAMSINLDRILSDRHLTARAGNTLILLSAPLVIALILLIPAQSDPALGWELVAAGALSLGALTPPWRRAPEQPLPHWIMTIATPPVLLSGSTLLGGLAVLTGSPGGLHLLALGVIAAFVGGLVNAWVLLVEILR